MIFIKLKEVYEVLLLEFLVVIIIVYLEFICINNLWK